MARNLGSNPRELRRVAHEFEIQAGAIDRVSKAMTDEVDQVWWEGPDAHRFKEDWHSCHQTTADRLVRLLLRFAECLRHEAGKQERVSSL